MEKDPHPSAPLPVVTGSTRSTYRRKSRRLRHDPFFWILVVLLIATMLLVVSCSSEEPPQPAPSTLHVDTSAPPQETDGDPSVSDGWMLISVQLNAGEGGVQPYALIINNENDMRTGFFDLQIFKDEHLIAETEGSVHNLPAGTGVEVPFQLVSYSYLAETQEPYTYELIADYP
jgi:hypothetical protein